MTRYPKPGELWKVGRKKGPISKAVLFELIILVKNVDIWNDEYGQRFTVWTHFDSETVSGILDDIDWKWQLIQSI